MKTAISLFLVSLFSNSLLAQNGWQPALFLYSDLNIKVEVQFKINTGLCTSISGKPSQYMYNLTGQPVGSGFYINWKVDYNDCSGNIICQTNYLFIYDTMPTGLIVDIPYTFAGVKVDKGPYGVETSTQPDLTKPYIVGTQKPIVSIAPDSITGKSTICRGDKNIKLEAIGGKLVTGSKWVWYRDNCNGFRFATGATIEVTPNKTTVYYLRAEGLHDTTDCVSKEVMVGDKSIPAVSILSNTAEIEGNPTICRDNPLTLKVGGGKLAEGSIWAWYENIVSANNKVGEGESINLSPSVSTTYKVKAEGICENSDMLSLRVTVNEKSKMPDEIYPTSGDYARGTRLQLFQRGGTLAPNANWVWYRQHDESSTKKQIGTGESISIKLRRKSTVKVRAEGILCDSANDFATSSYTVSRSYIGRKKFIYVNIGLASSYALIANPYLNPFGFNLNPFNTPTNLTLSIMSNKKGAFCWYLKGKYPIPQAKTKIPSTANYDSTIYTSQQLTLRYSATAGILFGFHSFRFFVGAGWGKSVDNSVSIDDYTSVQGQTLQVKNYTPFDQNTFEGLELESGFVLRLWRFNVLAGASTVTPLISDNKSTDPWNFAKHFKYFDFHTGIGFNF